MRALLLTPEGVIFTSDYRQLEPGEGEVPVRVLKAGICETDLQLMDGYMGFSGVLGHEFVGIAEAGKHKGERVVGEINCPCRVCETCRAGWGRHCPHRSVLGILDHDGAFADLVHVPEQNLHLVPISLSDELAVFTEPLAAAFEIPAQIDLNERQNVIVLGDGRLGNLCAQVIALHGCRLTVIGKHREKLALLEQRGIATKLLNQIEADRTADVVVDCTGSALGLTSALQFVRPRGTVVLKTTVAGEQTLSLAPIVIDEITVIGSRCGEFPAALAALQAGQIDPLPLITADYSLDEALTALQRAQMPGVLKVLLSVSEK